MECPCHPPETLSQPHPQTPALLQATPPHPPRTLADDRPRPATTPVKPPNMPTFPVLSRRPSAPPVPAPADLTCAICLDHIDDGDETVPRSAATAAAAAQTTSPPSASASAYTSSVLLPTCAHTFHTACIGEWVVAPRDWPLAPTCPVCRAVIPVDTLVALLRALCGESGDGRDVYSCDVSVPERVVDKVLEPFVEAERRVDRVLFLLKVSSDRNGKRRLLRWLRRPRIGARKKIGAKNLDEIDVCLRRLEGKLAKVADVLEENNLLGCGVVQVGDMEVHLVPS